MKNGTSPNKITVAYDYQTFVRQRVGGISRAFYEVNTRLAEREEFQTVYPVLYSQNVYFRNILPTSNLASRNRFTNYLVRLLNKFYFIRYLLQHRSCDIVHATYYSSYFYRFLPKRSKYILTVYDCIQELYSRKSLGNLRMRFLKGQAVRRADVLITLSENTKKDIIRLYRIPAAKIHVVPLACSQISMDAAKIRCDLPQRYILYVGMRNDYKNFDTFVRAVGQICLRDKDIRIVCVGKPFTRREIRLLESNGVEDRIVQIRANDNELYYIYQNALCFVYPSLYEGFGIPILEAFSNNCPVILSNTGCFPEVAGDAAVYFDPRDAGNMADKITEVIIDPKLRGEMIAKGNEKRKMYSWERTTDLIAEIYKNCRNNT